MNPNTAQDVPGLGCCYERKPLPNTPVLVSGHAVGVRSTRPTSTFVTIMAELLEFLAHAVDDSEPELPPGSPPTCEFISIVISARSPPRKSSSRVPGSRHKYYLHHLSDLSRSCFFLIVDRDGHCSSPLAPS